MKKAILLVTDFSYEAKGREYFREDVALSVFLRRYFKVWVSHIDDVDQMLSSADAVLIRNTGPQASHREQLAALRRRKDLRLFNNLSGKGDINGKGHLLELFQAGYPVIPSFASKQELQRFGTYERYLIKPLYGADSVGIKILSAEELAAEPCHHVVLQPLLDFLYEVSFYFIGRDFQYALFAPNPEKRWELRPYLATKEDVDFALRFVNWNSSEVGIQRVDACRLSSGELLLMELEDYNPFLSLDLVEHRVRERFLSTLCGSLANLMTQTKESVETETDREKS
jgi:hypothetical protein